MTNLLQDRVAIVTGAGHGIGRGHALELARHGAAVIVNDLGSSVNGEGSGRDAEVVVDIIKSRGGKATANFADVSDEEQARALIAQAYDEYGRLDVLVNNAGIVRDRTLWNMATADFDLVMNVHAKGTWLLCQEAAVRWRAGAKADGGTTYGRIINTTSGAGLSGNFGQTNYAAAKAAVVGMTLTMSLELASIGVTANCIGPGGITRISATSLPGDVQMREPDERAHDEFDPMDPSLSSPVVAWLASPEAGHVSGQVIKAIGDTIQLMGGWTPVRSVSSNKKRWDPTKLGVVLGRDIFETRAAGLRMGQ